MGTVQNGILKLGKMQKNMSFNLSAGNLKDNLINMFFRFLIAISDGGISLSINNLIQYVHLHIL